ncbi:hypothetical protein VL14_01990 [Cytobacillus firmus]|nr:hypothetical protein VL14_01990 [Cytobacillus firmus]
MESFFIAGEMSRNRANFGHRRRKSSAQSQNLWQLRTEEEKIQCPESEPGPSSDTGGENPVLRVRTRGNLGHKKLKSNVQSQNPDLLKGNGKP